MKCEFADCEVVATRRLQWSISCTGSESSREAFVCESHAVDIFNKINESLKEGKANFTIVPLNKQNHTM